MTKAEMTYAILSINAEKEGIRVPKVKEEEVIKQIHKSKVYAIIYGIFSFLFACFIGVAAGFTGFIIAFTIMYGILGGIVYAKYSYWKPKSKQWEEINKFLLSKISEEDFNSLESIDKLIIFLFVKLKEKKDKEDK